MINLLSTKEEVIARILLYSSGAGTPSPLAMPSRIRVEHPLARSGRASTLSNQWRRGFSQYVPGMIHPCLIATYGLKVCTYVLDLLHANAVRQAKQACL